MSNSAVENMFKHTGKTVNIIGKTRIKTYRDLYLQLSDLQKNKEIPVHSDYLGDNDLANNKEEIKYDAFGHIRLDEINPGVELLGERTLLDSLLSDSSMTVITDSEPFYPIQRTVEEIVDEVETLKARVIEYESRILNQDSNLRALRKIKFPHLKHEIVMTNGSIVNGTIVQENSDKITVKTQIGQLSIDKANITTIKDIAPNEPDVEFKGDATEEIYSDYRIFDGQIYNSGFRRADFVRVIYKLWSERTELIGADSSFVEGTKVVYKSGVISDTAMEPGYSAEFIVNVKADSSLVRYVTREIKWDTFE